MVADHGGEPVRIGVPKQHTVLAMLLVRANEPVTVARLVDEVWPGGGPASARANMTTYLSGLRRGLARFGCPLTRRDGGYALHTPPEAIDERRFGDLAGRAAAAWAAGRPHTASGHWAAALRLWRGEPFEGVPVGPVLSATRVAWTERRLTAADGHVRALLHLGQAAEAVPDLRGQLGEDPLREQSWLLLMASLHLSGNSAGALDAYANARAVMADQLGVEPGGPLRDLHQAILTDDRDHVIALVARGLGRSRAGAVSASGAEAGRPATVPAQLPADVRTFVGRDTELALLDRLVGDRAGTTTVAVVGTAGVGKTALATYWAHRVADRFPDGQLYADLRGFGSGAPASVTEVLGGLLVGLGVDAARLPGAEGDLAAMYRTRLTGQRMLIMLDNAESVAQVRPLLPGRSSCVVLVTSRDELAGLVARDGAARLDLDLLPGGDAVALLDELIAVGPGLDRRDRLRLLATLAEQCARLPLALRIAAELIGADPGRPMADLAAELADERHRLDLLSAYGDEDTAVRAAFRASYRNLSAQPARLLVLIGLHPGRSFDVGAVAALAGADSHDVRGPLDRLVRAHLLRRAGSGRFDLHDLLRVFTRELSGNLPDEEQRAASRRLLGHYFDTTAAAIEVLHPSSGAPTADPEAARAWLAAEHANLMAAALLAAEEGLFSYTVGFSTILYRYLDTHGYRRDAIELHRAALTAARHDADPAAEANALNRLGVTHWQRGEPEEALADLGRSLALYRQLADPAGQAQALGNLGLVHWQLAGYDQAIEYLTQSVATNRRIGNLDAEARGLTNLAAVHWRRGEYALAETYLNHALAGHRTLGDRSCECIVLANLGELYRSWDREPAALDHFRQALALSRETGFRTCEADVLGNIAEIHRRRDNFPESLEGYRRALLIVHDTGEPGREAALLNGLGQALTSSGDPEQALARHRRARTLAERTGDGFQQAGALDGMAVAHEAAGRYDDAEECWRAALARYTALGVPEADRVRRLLAGLPKVIAGGL